MYDIDLHILHFREPMWMLNRCLDSLQGQPVNIHIIKGISEWKPDLGRTRGFTVGEAPFQTLVDPDDVVKPGAFEELSKYLSDYDLIYGNEEVERDDKVCSEITAMHHAYLIRRGLLEMKDLIYCYRTIERARQLKLRIKHVDKVLYTWKAHEGHIHNGVDKC